MIPSSHLNCCERTIWNILQQVMGTFPFKPYVLEQMSHLKLSVFTELSSYLLGARATMWRRDSDSYSNACIIAYIIQHFQGYLLWTGDLDHIHTFRCYLLCPHWCSRTYSDGMLGDLGRILPLFGVVFCSPLLGCLHRKRLSALLPMKKLKTKNLYQIT